MRKTREHNSCQKTKNKTEKTILHDVSFVHWVYNIWILLLDNVKEYKERPWKYKTTNNME